MVDQNIKYPIVETFVSIQGEGSMCGTNMLFVRTFGCNMKCSFCDEPKHTQRELITEMTIEEIVQKAIQEGVQWVCITGGEPTLHDLRPLLAELRRNKIYSQVETNGTDYAHCMNADVITCSPKGDEIPEGTWSEIKLVIPAQQHLLNAALSFEEVVYVQPENYENEVNMENVHKCLELIKVYPTL